MPKLQKTCSLLLQNERKEILMMLRDNNPEILFPKCITTIGGYIEKGERPEQAMIREAKEELNYNLKNFEYIGTHTFRNKNINLKRYLFVKKDKIRMKDLQLNEGLKMVWISEKNIDKIKYRFGFGFKKVIRDYFKGKQFFR